MSHCVPTLDVDDGPPSDAAVGLTTLRFPVNSAATDIPSHLLGYEVAELAWENGQLVMHGLGTPRVVTKTPAPSTSASPWDKPRAGGTLESIVNQATRFPNPKPADLDGELIDWFNQHQGVSSGTTAPATGGSASVTMDALVPCSHVESDHHQEQLQLQRSRVVGSSCNGAREKESLAAVKRAKVAAREPAVEWSSVRGSATTSFGRDHSQRDTTMDTCELDVGMGFTSTSNGSPENTSSSGRPCTKTTAADDHDPVCHSRPQATLFREVGVEGDKRRAAGKSSVSTKRSRAAAIHNQSERKRRDKINQRMKTLQKLVPNSSKTDKASMLDEVIEYLKQLQAQVNMISRFNMPSMMLPMAMQQQLQMSMMANPMGLGMGMGMGLGVMDMHSMNRAAPTATATGTANASNMMMPNPFMVMPHQSWDGGSNDVRSQFPMMHDPMPAFFACSSQPMTMDTYSRMAALYQQMQQQIPQPPNSKT